MQAARAERKLDLQTQNLLLLSKMKDIVRKGSVVDNAEPFRPTPVQQPGSLSARRREDLLRIMEENDLIVKRIQRMQEGGTHSKDAAPETLAIHDRRLSQLSKMPLDQQWSPRHKSAHPSSQSRDKSPTSRGARSASPVSRIQHLYGVPPISLRAAKLTDKDVHRMREERRPGALPQGTRCPALGNR